ncbi:unnamed protein product [Rotaria magnacalcarata]|uniref:EGF-like domain-containing protein n=1 Tax=Rotaria magnacalcarata TaxID=392030 RepID=A0A8S2R6N5_9BILA|nr:unnamed protein product [Rotaria magnacalcarata]
MEYRSRQGICIHLQTTFDKVINCSDAAADYRANTHRLGGSSVFICDIIELLFCQEHDRPVNYFEDEKLLCPWQNPCLATHSSHAYFTCHNGLQIGFNQVCNGILNCANGEDELLCRIADPPWNEAYNDRFLLDIDIYHPTTARSSSDTCERGWIGTECNHSDLICHSSSCFPGSMFISVRRKSMCICPMNRFGPTCRIQITHICHEKTCQNNGTCLTLDVNARAALNQFECACPVGFVGLKCRPIGCGLYIIFSSILGTCCLVILTLKCISIVLLPYLSNRLSCICVEYFLKRLPTMVDWLNTSVLLERVRSTQSGLHFDKVKSKKIATVVLPIVIVCVGLSLLRDPFNRESIFDPRLNEGRWSWCVIRFEKDNVELYNMITITSLLHYTIPFIINIIAPVSVLVNVSHIKSTKSLQSSSERTINCVQTISPIVLIIFALPRLIFFCCLY